ncbi:SAV2-like protein, partial [Mya arenaria]
VYIAPVIFFCLLAGRNASSSCTPDLCKTPIAEGDNQCGIAGVYQNQLESVISFTCKDGSIDGRYCSAVGEAIFFYQLAGRYLVANDNVILGWTVSLVNAHGNSEAATSWTGISYSGQDTIDTQWLLVANKEEFWNTTTINGDTFTKVCI